MTLTPDAATFLPPHLLERLGGLDVVARTLVRGFQAGLHRATRRGAGEDFAKHREYQQGDDVRYVDWKIYGRTDRLFVREFEERSNLQAFLVLDATASMGFADARGLTKLRYGAYLAAALGHLMLSAGDAVGLATAGEDAALRVAPRARRGHLHAILLALQSLAGDGRAGAAAALDRAAAALPRRGRLVLISDLLEEDEGAALTRTAARLRARGDEVLVFRVLTPTELGEAPLGAALFFDPEHPDRAVPAVGADDAGYRERLQRYYADLAARLRAHGVEYTELRTDEPVEAGLLRWALSRRR
jgi:uncharacterized protein (DUF58 family)